MTPEQYIKTLVENHKAGISIEIYMRTLPSEKLEEFNNAYKSYMKLPEEERMGIAIKCGVIMPSH